MLGLFVLISPMINMQQKDTHQYAVQFLPDVKQRFLCSFYNNCPAHSDRIVQFQEYIKSRCDGDVPTHHGLCIGKKHDSSLDNNSHTRRLLHVWRKNRLSQKISYHHGLLQSEVCDSASMIHIYCRYMGRYFGHKSAWLRLDGQLRKQEHTITSTPTGVQRYHPPCCMWSEKMDGQNN